MYATNDTSDMDSYVDWVVDDLKWGTLVDYLASEEEARELSSRAGVKRLNVCPDQGF
ncbi:hypothetical protein [Corynebacterium sp. J010B-136]|uniref:hypothetical protein n=1 Tax=Corynebacterium sp. J010B-136 TaxID=2099401 RepID=UPI001304F896|nr:hypothetical protein [Corynebacterium sp. J010B-136]